MNREITINNILECNGVYQGFTSNRGTQEQTLWNNTYIQFKVFSNGNGIITGIGQSIFRNNTIPFIIIGEFNSYLKYITFRKVHVSNRVKNTIHYKGTIEFVPSETKISIHIDSPVSNGTLQIKNKLVNNLAISQFKGNSFKLTSKKSRFGCL